MNFFNLEKEFNIGKHCIKCSITYFKSYSEENESIKRFYNDCLNETFIHFTRETLFETKLFYHLTCDIIFKHSSFKAYCESYNCFNKSNDFSNERSILVEQRLIDGFFYYNILIYLIEICQKDVYSHYFKLNSYLKDAMVFLKP